MAHSTSNQPACHSEDRLSDGPRVTRSRGGPKNRPSPWRATAGDENGCASGYAVGKRTERQEVETDWCREPGEESDPGVPGHR